MQTPALARPAEDTQTDTDIVFEEIVGAMELDVVEERTVPKNNRITVLVDLPHVVHYGMESSTLELVYACNFPVRRGDAVLCPPTPRYDQWSTGMVIALDGGRYKGPVKAVRKIKDKKPS